VGRGSEIVITCDSLASLPAASNARTTTVNCPTVSYVWRHEPEWLVPEDGTESGGVSGVPQVTTTLSSALSSVAAKLTVTSWFAGLSSGAAVITTDGAAVSIGGGEQGTDPAQRLGVDSSPSSAG
jgi:hypothetical protein